MLLGVPDFFVPCQHTDPVMRNETPDVTLWHAPNLQAELLRARFVDFSYDVHTHDTACFALLTRGAIRIRMRGAEFIARAGDLYAIDADQPHAGWPVDSNGWQQRTLYVDLNYLRSLVRDEDVVRGISVAGPLIRDQTLAELFYEMHNCSQLQRSDAASALYCEEVYLKFAARLLDRHVRDADAPAIVGKESRAIRLAQEYLDQHLGQQVHLQDIAVVAGLPAFRLFRAFELATGMTPHAYQRQARVRVAKSLIRLNHSLADVSAATGFSDQAHLTRWFRRIMGVTPGAYRNAVVLR